MVLAEQKHAVLFLRQPSFVSQQASRSATFLDAIPTLFFSYFFFLFTLGPSFIRTMSDQNVNNI